FFFSSRRRHTRSKRDWSSDVCSSDLTIILAGINVFPAADDGVPGAPTEAEVSVRALRRQIAGVQPAFAVDGCGRGIGVLIVAPRSEERRVGKECGARWWACVER